MTDKKTKTTQKEVKGTKSTSKIMAKKTTSTRKAVKSVSKTAKKEVNTVKAEVKSEKSKAAEKGVSVKVAVYSVNGASQGTFTLPVEIFGATPNKALISQAVRVYLANQRQGNASTKTRSEVTGSTRKIYRQKGTGRARHGALKAPLFVGGGVAHGPKPHSFDMDMPKKMRKAALISALSQKAQEGLIKVVEGDFSGKTKEVAALLKAMDLTNKGRTQRTLFVIDENENAARAARNVDNLKTESAMTLSTYGVMAFKNVVFMKNSIKRLEERLNKN